MEERVNHAKKCTDEGCLFYAERKLEEAERKIIEAIKYYEAARSIPNQFKNEIGHLYKLLGAILEMKGDRKKANHYYELSHCELDNAP